MVIVWMVIILDHTALYISHMIMVRIDFILESKINLMVKYPWKLAILFEMISKFLLTFSPPCHGPLARYVKLRVAHSPGMPGTFSSPQRLNDPDMHHGTCVTRVPWCMLGSLTSGFILSRWRENVPGIPGASATRNFTYLVRGPFVKMRWHISPHQDYSPW